MAEAIAHFHAQGRPVGGALSVAPWGGHLHVTQEGGGLRSVFRTVVRWIRPGLEKALKVAGPIVGDVARTAAQAALSGQGSLAERVKAAQSAATEAARQQALSLVS